MKSLILVCAPLLVLGCKNSTATPTPDMAMSTSLGPAPMLAMPCADQAADVYNLPTGLPPMDMTHRGDVFHCAVTESLTASAANALIDEYNMDSFGTAYPNAQGGDVTSGFWTYRVAYRTLRVTPTGGGTPVEGDTAAVLLVPEHPLAGAPLVVFAHEAVGIAPKCAPSLLDLTSPVQDQDWPPIYARLAGYGYTVIAPDYAGYSYGQPPGFFNAEDEAHSVLDATRAAANLLPSPPDKVVLVGFSTGGHASLSAQSYAATYGMTGTLIGVAVWAPLETSMALWAAATTPAAGLTTANDTGTILYSMEAGYSAGVLRGDPGAGLTIFQTAKQQAAKDAMLGGECYDNAKVQALGATPADFFDMNYVMNVGFNCAANPLGSDCTQVTSTPAGDAPLWLSRWKQDRPALDPKSAPILVWFGGKDTYARPGFAECMREKWAKELGGTGTTTTIQYCFDPASAHRELPRTAAADYVNQWIAARAGLGAEPTGACGAFPLPWTNADGTTGSGCETPPNDL